MDRYTCEDDDAFNEMLAYGHILRIDVPFRRICKDVELIKIVIRHVKLNSYEVRIFVKELARRKMTKFVCKLSEVYDIPNQYMKFACQSGSFKAIKLARKLECGWSYGYDSFIVEHNRLDILKWMHENKFYFDWETLTKYASMCGNRSIYEWAKKKNNCDFIAPFCSYLTSGSVVFNGSIEVMNFAMKTYPRCLDQIFRGIVNAGNLLAVEYYLKRRKITEVCVHPDNNNFGCLKYIVAHGVKISASSRSYIHKSASADLMEWLFDNVEWIQNSPDFARLCIKMGYLFLLKRMKKAVIPSDAVSTAIQKGKLDIVIWLTSLGFTDTNAITNAIQCGNVKMVKWVDKNLMTIVEDAFTFRHSGNMEVSQYLESRGLSMDRIYNAMEVRRLTIEYVEKYPKLDIYMYHSKALKHIELCVFKKIRVFTDNEVINDLKKVRSIMAYGRINPNYINNLHPDVVGEIYTVDELLKQRLLNNHYRFMYLNQILSFLIDNYDLDELIKQAQQLRHDVLFHMATCAKKKREKGRINYNRLPR